MAFNLLVDLGTQTVDWVKLNLELKNQSNRIIEFFPIPHSLDTPKDYLGISIINSDFSDDKMKAIKAIILYLLKQGYKVFELYSSNEFLEENIHLLSNKFFK